MNFKLKLYNLKSKLWFNIFLQVAAIFAIFVTVLTLCNTTLLSKFFFLRQKNTLSAQTNRIDSIEISDTQAVSELLTDISENYNFDVEIYDSSGNIKYTTQGAQMMDFFIDGRPEFRMKHEELITTKRQTLANDVIYEEAVRRFDNNEFLLCRKQISDNLFAEVKIQKQLLLSSAATANEFITAIAILCLLLSLVWVIIFARRFSKPISQMNEITRDMANLKFDRVIEVDRSDEIGELAHSVNEMSASLSATLDDLNRTNAKLRDEIELERELDKMRKTFVANVSHELKTPIAIISGYAEGLKLNVNGDHREEYCDTIIDESNRMNKLVLGILELSKYESGQIPANKTTFDIYDMADMLLSRIFDNCDIVATNNIPRHTMVFADQAQIEQALRAYIENAKSHVTSGGTITLFSEDTGDKMRVCVHNTGSHIAKEKMPYIWQSFYRGDDSHKRDKTRFGLGLSIVNAVMNIHNNNCGVYNTDDGVTFWLELDRPTL